MINGRKERYDMIGYDLDLDRYTSQGHFCGIGATFGGSALRDGFSGGWL